MTSISFSKTENQKALNPSMKTPRGIIYFSNKSSINRIDLQKKKLEEVIENYEDGHSTNDVYPVFSPKTKKIYFIRQLSLKKRYIACYDLTTKTLEKDKGFAEPYQIIISPDGIWLAYFVPKNPTQSHSVDLVIQNVLTNQTRMVAGDAAWDSTELVWISNHEIAYQNSLQTLSKVDIDTGKGSPFPLTLVKASLLGMSGNGSSLMYEKFMQNELWFYDLKSQVQTRVLKFHYFHGPYGVISSPTGKCLIYSRDDWGFSETGNLFWRNLDSGKEIRLAKRVAIFGGFWLEDATTE